MRYIIKVVYSLRFIAFAIFSYLVFNIAVWISSNLISLAFANILTGVITAFLFWKEVKETHVKWVPVFLGAISIVLMVDGLFRSHKVLPASLAIEAVYNGFAVFSWPLFFILSFMWSSEFKEKPTWFHLACHVLMATMVAIRFSIHKEISAISIWSFLPVLEAIAGYACFNIALKISNNNRRTNVCMNLTGGLFLAIYAVVRGLKIEGVSFLLPGVLAGVALVGVVWALGAAYKQFSEIKKSSLVVPLVYDGILVASPLVAFVTREGISVGPNVALAIGMITVTFLRWHYS